MGVKDQFRSAMERARANTLRLFTGVGDADFCRQLHPDFSPLGWHLGHIGVTESYWILQQCKGEPTLSTTYDHFFTPTDNPKPNRINLPPRAEILAYVAAVRERVLRFLDTVDLCRCHPLLKDGGIFNMLLQHEEQHNETILLIKQLLAADSYDTSAPQARNGTLASSFAREDYSPLSSPPGEENHGGDEETKISTSRRAMGLVPAGSFLMGSNSMADTLDNERPQHSVFVEAFLVDRSPVTNREFLQFVETEGYRNRSWWSAEGWRWREDRAITHPLYWRQQSKRQWLMIGLNGVHLLALDDPVVGVSWYEAEAYAQFVKKRLLTEAEWEKAAAGGYLDRSGYAWEWTSTWFQPYPGFRAHPYEGYSVPYFDGRHRVLRGGSWATHRHVRRVTFRNWYQPWVREIFAGLRCAQDC